MMGLECTKIRNLSIFLELTLFLILLNQPIIPAKVQLEDWRKAHRKRHFATSPQYSNVPALTATLGVGDKGPLLLQDTTFQFHLSGFANERIPERIVHSKGAGAKGYFVVTHSMAKWTKAKVFGRVGKKTPVVARFSTTAGNVGTADTVVDNRGFSVKFKTEEGVYDLLMLNLLVFGVADSMLFPALSLTRARNPQTNLLDPEMFWDFRSLRPETTLNVLQLHSDLAYFKSYRYMEGHAINGFSWVGGSETTTAPVFVRYHLLPNQKKTLSSYKTFLKLAGSDPDYMIRTLYNDIRRKKFPSWTLTVQMFTMEDVQKASFNLFDATKMLFEKDFPMIPVGTLVLNENPTDYFNDVEQVMFNPGNLVPGIEMSPDRLLQGRAFGYLHSQISRLGINHQQIPINRGVKGAGHSYIRDGPMNIDGNDDGGPNFFPNSFNGPYVNPKAKELPTMTEGGVVDSEEFRRDDNYVQVDRYWREVMGPGERKRTVQSIARHLAKTSKETQERSFKANWDPVNPEVSRMMRVAAAKENERNNLKRKGRKRKLK